MALAVSSNDKSPIRHDQRSLFNGGAIRDLSDETQMVKLASGSLVYYDVGGTYRVTYKAVSNAYTGPGNKGFKVNSEFSSEFVPAGDSSANDYMIDWARARFNSVTLETYDSVNQVWRVSTKYSITSSLKDAFPNRYTQDTVILKEITDSISTSPTATYGANFYDSWELQCALYNWQYPLGSSVAQVLFGNDSLIGTRLNDVMTGAAGNDTISGGAGNDVLYGSFGADILYGEAGNDTLVFDGGSSVWDYKAGTSAARGAYVPYTIDSAAGGTGADFFVFNMPTFEFTPSGNFPDLPDIYGNPTGTTTKYNPFLSQSQNATPYANYFNVSPLTFRTRILDFKVGEDKLDLTNFGVDLDFISAKKLVGLSGDAFIKAANLAIKADGYALSVVKSGATSNNTTLLVSEAAIDTNVNGKTNDVLLEIQLVGLTTSAISAKMFGDAPAV